MKNALFFTSPTHQQRFVATLQQLGKVYRGTLDPEYGSALYLLTAHAGIWQQVEQYVSRRGIDVDTILEHVDLSGGMLVLILLAGNLFNGNQHLDPLEFLRLDERNFQVALTALLIRRDPPRLNDMQ